MEFFVVETNVKMCSSVLDVKDSMVDEYLFLPVIDGYKPCCLSIFFVRGGMVWGSVLVANHVLDSVF